MKSQITKAKLLKKYQGIKHSLNKKIRRLWCASEAGHCKAWSCNGICCYTNHSTAEICELRGKPRRKKSAQRILRKGSCGSQLKLN